MAVEPSRRIPGLGFIQSSKGGIELNGLSMPLGDLLSAGRLELRVKVVVYNTSLGFVTMEMKAGGYLHNGSTDLQATDFAAIADGAGIRGTPVTESEALPGAVERFLAHPGPAVLDVVTNRHALALPPKVEWTHAKGFSLDLLRAVLNGRSNEVPELTQTNLLRSCKPARVE